MQVTKFTKMQSLGNDFVMLDGVTETVTMNRARARKIADRHFGIGCDQIIVAEPGPEEQDFMMRIFNHDGSEVGQCGNGARCFAAFVRDLGLTDKTRIGVQTATTALMLEVKADGQVAVAMGRPEFCPANIPLAEPVQKDCYTVEYAGDTLEFAAMALGNPHCTFTVDSVRNAPLEQLGAWLQTHSLFPQRVNVGFAERVSEARIRLRVYERGVGETLGCGSGACAAAVSLIRRGVVVSPVAVALPGGEVTVSWRGDEVILTGPVNYVFHGVLQDTGPASGTPEH